MPRAFLAATDARRQRAALLALDEADRQADPELALALVLGAAAEGPAERVVAAGLRAAAATSAPADAGCRLGEALLAAACAEPARAAFRASLDLAESPAARAGLAAALDALGRPGEARREAALALGTAGADPFPRLVAARLAREAGDVGGALDALEPLLRAEPPVEAAWVALGEVAAHVGAEVRLTRVPYGRVAFTVGSDRAVVDRGEVGGLLASLRSRPPVPREDAGVTDEP